MKTIIIKDDSTISEPAQITLTDQGTWTLTCEDILVAHGTRTEAGWHTQVILETHRAQTFLDPIEMIDWINANY